ncbi:MAG: hypothetical protein ACRDHG_14945 [Anaerolineales bacterium]
MKVRPLVILLLGCLLWLAPAVPDPSEVLYWRGGAFSDLLITHWPNAAFLRRSLLEWGQIPLWNPTILSGAPTFADPLSGLWYPPLWLAAWLPPALTFNLLTYLHLVGAGLGTWRLARRLGLDHGAASLAGLAFSGAPKLIGHVGLGHVTLVLAVCWTPWILLAVDSAARAVRASPRRRLQTAALAGGAAGLVFLIDPRWFPYVLLIAIPFAMWVTSHSHIQVAGSAEDPRLRADGLAADNKVRGAFLARGRGLGSLAVGGLASVGVAAGLALPLAEFVRLSTRAGLSSAESTVFSLPLEKLPNLLAPDLGAWPEWQTYAGAVVLFLASVALAFDWRRSAFWGAAAAVSLLIALGSGSPPYSMLRSLVPGLAQLRVPPRSLFLCAFALAVLAGHGLQRLRSGVLPAKRLLGLGSAIAFATLLAGWNAASRAPAGGELVIWLPHLISVGLIGIGLAWARVSRQGSGRAWAGWVVLLLLDLGLVNFVTLELRPGAGLVDPRAQAMANLVEGSPPPRIFSPSYSLPQPSSVLLGVETADGVNPLQLASYNQFMSEAVGIPREGYSVTLPPFPEGGPQVNQVVELDAELLGLLSISEVLAAYPLQPGGFEPAGMLEGHYRYTNPAMRPRAWVETRAAPGWRAIQSEDWTPNRIRIVANGPGRLVLSELTYPGWKVEVDGEPAILQTASGLFRAVDLPAGAHEIEFRLRPASLIAGLGITLLAGLALTSLWVRR